MCLDTVFIDEDEKDLRGEEKESEAVEKREVEEKRMQTKEEGKTRWQACGRQPSPIWQATDFWYFTMEWQTCRPQVQLWKQSSTGLNPTAGEDWMLIECYLLLYNYSCFKYNLKPH